MPPTVSRAPLPDPITEAPGKDELAARLARVQSRMRDEGLDAYVSFDPVNVYYLTNFANNVHERPFLLVIPPQGTPAIVAPLLETSHVRARARCDLEYATYYEFPAPEGENWWDVYAQVVDSGACVGIEPAMPSGIRERTPGTTVISDIIDDVRIVKSAYEIGRNVHACRVVELGHEKLLEGSRPGTFVGALYAAASQAMMARILGDIPHANLVVTRTVGAVWPPSISHDPHLIPTATAWSWSAPSSWAASPTTPTRPSKPCWRRAVAPTSWPARAPTWARSTARCASSSPTAGTANASSTAPATASESRATRPPTSPTATPASWSRACWSA
jgi:hypothetical protein